jgi:type VI protein secretion system component Hcp
VTTAVRKSRKYRDDLLDREAPSVGPDVTEERGLADETLRLQELVGNANTTELIARSPLQRNETAADAAPAKSGEEEKGSVYTMTMADIGTFDLMSFSWGTSSVGAQGPGPTGKEQQKHSDLVATKKGGDEASAKIMQRAADGKHIATVEVVMKKDGKTYATITLKDAYVTSFQTSGSGDQPLETFSLTFAGIEYKYEPEAGT